MSEIEIKADLEKLEDFKELALRLSHRWSDPWLHAKDTYLKWTGTHHGSDHPLKHVADYICFLEEENKRLVSELESRPVVWMLRSKYTGLLEMSGDYPDIYCLAHAKQFNPNSYSLEPYNRGAR